MSARDILFIVLAISAATLTAFLAWLLYYLIAIVRDLRQTSRAIHEKVDQVGTILESIKERISDSASTLSILTQVISKAAGSWRKRKAARTAKESDEA